MDSNTNFLQVVFCLLANVMALAGFVMNYGSSCLPTVLVQIFRYGRANMVKVKSTVVTCIEVPKSWFAHFYFFSVLTQTLIVYSVLNVYEFNPEDINALSWLKNILALVGGDNRKTTVNIPTTVLAVCLFWLHVTRRLFENVFVSVFSGTKMNVLHYGLAFVHYSGAMISLICHSPEFSNSSMGNQKVSWNEINIFQWLAVGLFFYGSLEQYKSHAALASLRKSKDNKVVTYEHKIPSGGLFELISCPNYFQEIVIYVSIACLFLFQNVTWNYVTIWVISNQVTSAVMNHKWYLERFPQYPKQRKAIIPYVY